MRRTLEALLCWTLLLGACGGGVVGAAPATSTTVSAPTTTVTTAAATATTVTNAPATSTTTLTTAATPSTVGGSGAGGDDQDQGQDDYDYGGYDDGPTATTVPATTVPATTMPATTAPATTVPATTGEGGGATVTVGAENFAFSPATVTVKVGDTVQWVLRDGSHTTTSGTPAAADGLWNEVITVDVPVSIPFDEAGEYRFFCRFHPDSMTGTIVVEA
jgi:plastocyanin